MALERAKSDEPGTTLIDQARERQKAEKIEKQVGGLKITVTVENAKGGREDEPAPPPPDPQAAKVPVREDPPTIDFVAPVGLQLRSSSGGHPKLTFSITIAG